MVGNSEQGGAADPLQGEQDARSVMTRSVPSRSGVFNLVAQVKF